MDTKTQSRDSIRTKRSCLLGNILRLVLFCWGFLTWCKLRFAEADLRRVRNRSGFLAGIMRKHGSSSLTSTQVAIEKPPIPKDADEGASEMGAVHPHPPSPPIPADAAAVAGAAAGEEMAEKAVEAPEAKARSEANAQELSTSHPAEVDHPQQQQQLEKQAVYGGNCSGSSCGDDTGENTDGQDGGKEVEDEVQPSMASGDGVRSVPQEEPLSRRAQKRQEDEEIRKLLEEEGDGDDFDGFAGGEGGGATGAAAASAAGGGSSAAAAFSELDRLTGKPRDEDVLMFAVPVCGPYVSLRDYRYKVKKQLWYMWCGIWIMLLCSAIYPSYMKYSTLFGNTRKESCEGEVKLNIINKSTCNGILSPTMGLCDTLRTLSRGSSYNGVWGGGGRGGVGRRLVACVTNSLYTRIPRLNNSKIEKSNDCKLLVVVKPSRKSCY